MTDVGQSRSVGLSIAASTVVLVIAALTSTTFVAAVGGLYVPGLGRDNMGAALALAFLTQVTGLGSIILALTASVGGVFAWWRGWPARRWLAALGLALMPTVLLLLLDAAPF